MEEEICSCGKSCFSHTDEEADECLTRAIEEELKLPNTISDVWKSFSRPKKSRKKSTKGQ